MLKRRFIYNKLNYKSSLSLSIADMMYPVECSIRLYGVDDTTLRSTWCEVNHPRLRNLLTHA